MPLTNYVPTPKFEDCKDLFKEHFVMERRDGIIELRMHTLGGDVQWNFKLHRALWQGFPLAERARLLQQLVHERGLAVIHVRNDRDVAEPFYVCAFCHCSSFANFARSRSRLFANSCLSL